jgi:DNA mismatch repair protein MutS
MTFHSILFEGPEGSTRDENPSVPDFFADLNLDQIVDAITAGKKEYNLRPFFLVSLKSVEAVEYRHEVMRDLETAGPRDAIKSFAGRMRTMRGYLETAASVRDRHNKEGWFLSAVEAYCKAVNDLTRDLAGSDLKSAGLSTFLEYLKKYVVSDNFTSLLAEAKKLRTDLSTLEYSMLISRDHGQFTVRKYEGEADYTPDVVSTFEKFARGAPKDYSAEFSEWPDMNHVEEAVLDLVARLYPDVFRSLENYYAEHADYLDKTIADFDREVHFYVAYQEFMRRLEWAGLHFCYPRVSDKTKDVESHEGFDLALANKLVGERSPVVCNDFFLKGDERIFVVNGPNQGGKTTFARAFGQLHYLASLGCPVPGKDARLFLFDRLFTHFEREEDINNLRSKLEDDMLRVHSILSESTPNSVIIINELFSSSTVQDAVFLGEAVLEQIIQLDALCVYVTFLDELSSLEKAVSVLSTVVPENPELRTYKIVRRPADGLAYAIAIAKKYRLSYDSIMGRIPQ